MRFNEGDIVRIGKKSEWYGLNAANPEDMDGEITDISDDLFPIFVRWDNGKRGCFNEEDLRLRKRA